MNTNAAKDAWKARYRAERVAMRESRRCLDDFVVFGRGIFIVDGEGVTHVPLRQVQDWKAILNTVEL